MCWLRLLELLVGLLIAQLLNANFKGRTFARTINLIPWAVPTIVAGYGFRWFLDDQFGLLPNWYHSLTGNDMVIFIDPTFAKIAVILVHVWKDAPFMSIVFWAGMQGVPLDLYEAAKMDGANGVQRFLRITLPLVMPLVITMGLFRIVWSLSGFDLVYGLTSGGPGVATSVLALQVFREGILFFKFGFASAISVVLLIFVGVVGIVGLALYRRADVAYCGGAHHGCTTGKETPGKFFAETELGRGLCVVYFVYTDRSVASLLDSSFICRQSDRFT